MAPKASSQTGGKGKGDELQTKSPAEFFAEHRTMAGFDNPGKCLYTTVRELVENALDSAESISQLPDIRITIEEVSKKALNRIRGVEHQERLDMALYQDFESQDALKKRQAKETKDAEKVLALIAKKGDGPEVAAMRKEQLTKKSSVGRGSLFYRVTVEDNGSGMAHKDIPNMLGRVLSGTKYGVKQTRGKFGLGAKMALIWSKMTTGLPFDIKSAKQNQGFVSHYVLDIDIIKNEPNVHKEEQLPNQDKWHGASLSLTIEGSWSHYRSKIIKYLRQIAVITPYAEFTFTYTPEAVEEQRNAAKLVFKRRTDVMPPAPLKTRHHPSSVDLELIKRLAADTKATTMAAFLRTEFDCIGADHATRLIEEMRSGVDSKTSPRTLDNKQVVRLHQLLREAKFAEPTGKHLSPAGEYNLRLGVMKELHPELLATHQGDVHVYEGHAFIVEAAVSLGGRDLKAGINVYRFANRIPLLFEGGSDVITRTATKRINWSNYKINQVTDKVGVFVSIVSTKVPFKGAGKEYIGDDVEEMVVAVRQALMLCCIQLKSKIARAVAAREQKLRKKNLTKYIPNCCSAIWKVLEDMANREPRGPKRRRLQLEEQASNAKHELGTGGDLLDRVRSEDVGLHTLTTKLAEHIERIDTDLALEYQMQQGMGVGTRKDAVYLLPQSRSHEYGPELHSTTCVVRLIADYAP